MAIIDFHSHILPGIDDGSKNTDTSLKMLERVIAQKVDVIVATPHFYADYQRIEEFLTKRDEACFRLKKAIEADQKLSGLIDTSGLEVGDEQKNVDTTSKKTSENNTKITYTSQENDIIRGKSVHRLEIKVGAEVAYYPGIRQTKKIKELLIVGTDLLLLEMPFGRWRYEDVAEVAGMIKDHPGQIILAHPERYLSEPTNRKYLKELVKLDVTMQFNAGSMLSARSRRFILKNLKKSTSVVLGSDTHGIRYREPNLDVGRELIAHKRGEDALQIIDQKGEELLCLKKHQL